MERKSYCVKAESRGRGGAKEKTLECGQIVWGLAFSPWLPPRSRKPVLRVPGDSCLVLATGLNDGQIKIWEVQTGTVILPLMVLLAEKQGWGLCGLLFHFYWSLLIGLQICYLLLPIKMYPSRFMLTNVLVRGPEI